MPSKSIIRRKEGVRILEVFLEYTDLIDMLYATAAFLFFFFFEQKWYDFIMSSSYFAKASETELQGGGNKRGQREIRQI